MERNRHHAYGAGGGGEGGRSPSCHLARALHSERASLVAQTVKNLPAVQETRIPSLGWEYPLEMGMRTHSNILVWRIPWTEEPCRIQSMGSQRVGQN